MQAEIHVVVVERRSPRPKCLELPIPGESQGFAKAVFSRGGELQSEDVVEWIKRHFEEVLNPANNSCVAEAGFQGLGE